MSMRNGFWKTAMSQLLPGLDHFKCVTHPPISSYRCIIHCFLFFSIFKKKLTILITLWQHVLCFSAILIEDMFVVSWSEVMTSGRRKKARCLLLSVLAAICSRQTVVFCVAHDNVRGLLLCTGEENTWILIWSFFQVSRSRFVLN